MEENEIFVEELIERLMEYYIRIRKESGVSQSELELSLIHISEPTRP